MSKNLQYLQTNEKYEKYICRHTRRMECNYNIPILELTIERVSVLSGLVGQLSLTQNKMNLINNSQTS